MDLGKENAGSYEDLSVNPVDYTGRACLHITYEATFDGDIRTGIVKV